MWYIRPWWHFHSNVRVLLCNNELYCISIVT
jgi:hypothetical protein